MTTATAAIKALDQSLAEHGQTITLRRVSGATTVDVSVPAFVRGYQPKEIVGSIQQGDTVVTLSPSSLGTWPGALAQSDGTDTQVPKKGDKVLIAGRLRNIEAASPVYIGATLVRINLQVRG